MQNIRRDILADTYTFFYNLFFKWSRLIGSLSITVDQTPNLYNIKISWVFLPDAFAFVGKVSGSKAGKPGKSLEEGQTNGIKPRNQYSFILFILTRLAQYQMKNRSERVFHNKYYLNRYTNVWKSGKISGTGYIQTCY